MIKVALTNLGRYNAGYLDYTWLELPYTEDEFQQAKDKIGINEFNEEWFISDFETDMGIKIDEYENLDKLNEFASQFDSLDEYDQQKVKAILENGNYKYEEVLDVYDDAQLYPDVKDEYDLGYYWINEAGVYDLNAMGNLANYIDYESFGRDINMETEGGFTDYGYLEIAR